MAAAASSLATLLHLLHRASQRADGVFTRQMSDLTPRQFAILEAVGANNGLSQTAIMAATGIDRSSTAELVRRLVKARHLQRRRTRHDARAYAVRITPAGRQLLSKGRPAARTVQDQLLSPYSEREREIFVKMLQRMAAEVPAGEE